MDYNIDRFFSIFFSLFRTGTCKSNTFIPISNLHTVTTYDDLVNLSDRTEISATFQTAAHAHYYPTNIKKLQFYHPTTRYFNHSVTFTLNTLHIYIRENIHPRQHIHTHSLFPMHNYTTYSGSKMHSFSPKRHSYYRHLPVHLNCTTSINRNTVPQFLISKH